MRYEILYQPSYAVARVMLEAGESVRAESGAMMSMTPNVVLDSKMKGGLGGAFTRMLGGESAFQSTFTAQGGPGEVVLAPSVPGDILAINLQNTSMLVTSGCFLACESDLNVQAQANMKAFFSGEGLFMLRISGDGPLLLNSFGAIHAIQLPPGQTYIVDTGHLVAFSDGMPFNLRRATKGIMGMVTSGEGIVAELTGPGLIYTQTRTPGEFARWLGSLMPGRG